MSTQRDDGGPAFPRPIGQSPTKYNDSQVGMALRDWMAGMALSSLMATYATTDHPPADEIASYCYWLADAMLVERSKP